jgi:drug/metabolite transporter (DMT)-like permease
MSIATVLLAITMLLLNISFYISLNQLIYLTLSGIVGLTIGDSFLFRAFKDMGPRVSLLIYSLNPAVATFLAVLLFGETLSWLSLLGIGLTLAGIIMVVLEKPKENKSIFKVSATGVFFAFMAAVGQASGLIFAKYAFMEADIHSFTATFYRILTAVVLLLPSAYVLKRYKNPFKLYAQDMKTLSRLSIGSITGPYLGITLSFIAVSSTKIGIASTLLSTVPIMILPMSAIVYKEKLSLTSILGAVVAVAGISLLFI